MGGWGGLPRRWIEVIGGSAESGSLAAVEKGTIRYVAHCKYELGHGTLVSFLWRHRWASERHVDAVHVLI